MQNVLLQYGALGVFVLVLLAAVKVIFDKLQAAYDNEKARADRLEEQIRSLNETMRTDYMTTLNVASQAIVDANRAVADALSVVRRGQ
jgi:hypothetical protein